MADPRSTSIATAKAALRRTAAAKRAACDPALASMLTAQVLTQVGFSPGEVIACVWPLPGEPDLRPMLHELHARGHSIGLPETPPRGGALIFRRWWPGVAMITERFGTMRPDSEIIIPGSLLVPLLAFDRRGFRLGYGGGYYDRTLAALPGRRAIGFGYAAQEVDSIPVEPHDRAMDLIVTEAGIVPITRAVL